MTIKQVSEKYNIPSATLRYYERVGAIPEVARTRGGVRKYGESDLNWVELALCMRGAGLPIEALVKYVALFKKGDETIRARLTLLQEQKSALLEQKQKIDDMVNKLDYKISRYEIAAETGKLTWK